MRLTALVESPEHVCCRYRLAAFRSALEAAGYQLELHPWPRSCWSWLRIGRTLQDADAVIVQRRLPAAGQLYRLRSASRCLLFDFDDAVFLRDSYSPRGLASVRRLQRFAAVVESADAVIAGNHYLHERAAQWTAPDRVHVIPTCVPAVNYPLAEHTRNGEGVQMVWIGSASTLQGLEQIRPLLELLGHRHPGLQLKLVCDQFLELRRLPVIASSWSGATETTDLASADIGISWLPDDAWSRGKCGLKVLQYMAAGLPVVANPVGVQADLVQQGESGFLARTPDEWSAAIGRLARDPELRRRMGRAGRRRVEADFGVALGASRWLALLDGLQKKREAA